MIPEISELDLRVHLLGGSVLELEQRTPAKARETLGHLNPQHIFDHPLITIAGDHQCTTLRTAFITSVEARFDGSVDWSYGPNLDQVDRISESEFTEAVSSGCRDESLLRSRPRKDGDPFEGYDRIELAGGRVVHLRVHGTTRPRAVQARAVTRFFEGPSVLARIPSEGDQRAGYEILNPANMISVRFYPGSPEVPAETWFAHLKR